MDFFNQYKDWIYIGAVLVAFFIFVAWNYTKQKPSTRGGKRSFKQRMNDKRKGE
ncbi:MAG: hypothetical protein NWQ09_03005 [Nonlabens sp.]|nr:hypothetical protein [Nonlabens sp.]